MCEVVPWGIAQESCRFWPLKGIVDHAVVPQEVVGALVD